MSDVNISDEIRTRDSQSGLLTDDTLLMKRVADRDVKAFEDLYDRHHLLVYGLALRMLQQPAAAEDITQAVFTRVWYAPTAFRGGNFAAWIGRVTRNRCLDELRGASSANRNASQPNVESTYVDVEQTALAQLESAAVYTALSRLPSEQRSLIELAFFSGLTQAELSKRTGVPLGTVKSRIRAGLLALRTALKETES